MARRVLTEEQKERQRQYFREWREKNRERRREQKRARYAANPEKFRKESRERSRTPEERERHRLYMLQWNAAHREHVNAKRRKYRKEHSDTARATQQRSREKHLPERMEWDRQYHFREGRGYRRIAKEALGRSLKPGEVVHHIDCDRNNNDPSNFWYCTHTTHRVAHGSLNRLVKQLMAEGRITFDREAGLYRLT